MFLFTALPAEKDNQVVLGLMVLLARMVWLATKANQEVSVILEQLVEGEVVVILDYQVLMV